MPGFQFLNVTYAKDVTTEGGEFQTFQLETWDDEIEDMLNGMEADDWERVSVVVEASEFEAEINKHISDTEDVLNVLEALERDARQAGYIVAFLMCNDTADVLSWTDRIYMSGPDAESLVREWAEVFHHAYEQEANNYSWSTVEYKRTDPFPSWMVLDWNKTLAAIADEHNNTVVEFDGEIYMFSND